MEPPDGPHRKRRRTYNDPGHAHELTFSCHMRLPLLSRDRTRLWFLEALDRARRRQQFEVWAYVLMPEHVNLLIRPRQDEYDISRMLKAIKFPVARTAVGHLQQHAPHWLTQLKVARPNGRTEHRFWQQGGGYDRNIHEDDVACTTIEYIHNNPVRRGLVEHPTDWPWSSARWYADLPDIKLEGDSCDLLPTPNRSARRGGAIH